MKTRVNRNLIERGTVLLMLGVFCMVGAPSMAFPQVSEEFQAYADSLYGGAVQCTVYRTITIIILPEVVVDSTALGEVMIPLYPERETTWTDGERLHVGLSSAGPVHPGSGWVVDLERRVIGEWDLDEFGLLKAETTDLRWSMHDYPPPANPLRAVRGE